MMRRNRKKWRERLHLDGKVVSSLSVLMVAVIMVFVMATSVNCRDELGEATTKNYIYSTNDNPPNPVGSLQQIPSQISSAISPQNYMSGNQPNFFPGQQSLLSGPANMLPGAQSLLSAPASFFPGAQNFMSAPSSLAQGAQNLFQAPTNFIPGQSFMSGDGANILTGPAKMLAAAPTALQGAGTANKGPAGVLLAPATLIQTQLTNFLGGQSKSSPNNQATPENGTEEAKADDPATQYISYGQDQKSKYQSQAISYKHDADFSEFSKQPPTPPPNPYAPNATTTTEAPSSTTTTQGTPALPTPPAVAGGIALEGESGGEDQSKTTAKPVEDGESTTMRVIGG